MSNFEPEHLERLAQESAVVPAVNQIELHPYLQQATLQAADAERGIVTEAWSPLAQGALLADPILASIADRRGVDIARVALIAALERGGRVGPDPLTFT